MGSHVNQNESKYHKQALHNSMPSIPLWGPREVWPHYWPYWNQPGLVQRNDSLRIANPVSEEPAIISWFRQKNLSQDFKLHFFILLMILLFTSFCIFLWRMLLTEGVLGKLFWIASFAGPTFKLTMRFAGRCLSLCLVCCYFQAQKTCEHLCR